MLRAFVLLLCCAAHPLSAQVPAPKIQELKPASDRATGLALYIQGDHAAAIPYLKRAIEANPGDKEAIQLLGLAYFFTGSPADAVPLLEQVNSWFPSANVDGMYVLGVSYVQLKNYDKARSAFARMYGVPADSAAAHLFLARMLLRQGFDPIAEQNALKAQQLDPRLPGVNYLLGELYLYKSRVPEAIAAFEKELEIDPAGAATYYKLGDAYSRALKFDDAQRLLQRSIWLDATASGPYILMGKVLLKKNELTLAERTLRHALGMDPNNVMAHHLLGQTYRAQGRNDDADRELQLANKLQDSQKPGASDQPQINAEERR